MGDFSHAAEDWMTAMKQLKESTATPQKVSAEENLTDAFNRMAQNIHSDWDSEDQNAWDKMNKLFPERSTQMKCDVYPCPIGGVKECLIVPEGIRLGQLPPSVQTRFKHAELWPDITIEPSKIIDGIDTDEALRAIYKTGFYIASVSISEVAKWKD